MKKLIFTLLVAVLAVSCNEDEISKQDPTSQQDSSGYYAFFDHRDSTSFIKTISLVEMHQTESLSLSFKLTTSF